MILRTAVVFIFFVVFPTLIFAQVLDGQAGTTNCNFSVGISCSFCDVIIILANLYFLFFDVVFRLGVMVLIASIIIIFSKKFDKNWIAGAEKAIKWTVIVLVIAVFSWLLVNTILYFVSDEHNRRWGKVDCSRFDSNHKTIDAVSTKSVVNL